MDFSLAGLIDIRKSHLIKSDVPGEIERRIIVGALSTPDNDVENERLIQKSLDWSYFDKSGVIKYEHDGPGGPRPDNIIGFPHERTTNEQGTYMQGALLKGMPYSDATWQLVQAIRQHNEDFPDNPKTLGFSIEGKYTDGNPGRGGARKAQVINVDLTPNPINLAIWSQTMRDNHAQFAKSLAATPVTPPVTIGEIQVLLVDLRSLPVFAVEERDDAIPKIREEYFAQIRKGMDPFNIKIAHA